MKTIRVKITVLAILIAVICGAPAFGWKIVFDPSNFGKNVEQVIRTLELMGITQEQLSKMNINLEALKGILNLLQDPYLNNLSKMEAITANAGGLRYLVNMLESLYRQLYPKYSGPVATGVLEQQNDLWIKQTDESIIEAMKGQGGVEDLAFDRYDLEQALLKARQAVGNLQVTQAQSEISAINAKQLLRMQQMLATSMRAETTALAQENAVKKAEKANHEFLMRTYGEASTGTPLTDWP